MAVVQQIQPYIYHTAWEDYATRDMLIQGTRARIALADSSGDPFFILMIDLRHTAITAFNVKVVNKALESHPRLVRFLVVGAPYITRVATEILSAVSATPVETYTSMQEALLRAQEIAESSQLAGAV